MAGMPNHRHARLLLVLPLLLVLASALPSAAQPPAPAAPAQVPAKDAVPGVRNFTKIDATIACGGAVTADAFPALKAAGFASVVNLRAATEQGVNIEADQKAAQDAGLKYYHLPFVVATPDSAKIDEFLKLVAAPANQPMLLHCASGGRASLFWAVKRVMLDGWTVEKALNETDLAKNANPAAKTAITDYLKAHGKGRP
jgi:uncharacterized protein (TIGR01244 family)